MKIKSVLAIFTSVLFLNSCTLLNQPASADDDIYFSSTDISNKGKTIIPSVDVEKLKKDFPSKVDPNKTEVYYNDNGTANPNAVTGYPIYKANQDSFYKIHPELLPTYQAYKMPPFSLRDEYLLAKAERKQQRRLARINNRRYNNNNYNNFGYYNDFGNNFGCNNGFYNGFGYNNGWGNFGFGPVLNFGFNNFNGWNSGIGFGFNNFGFNNFGFNSFYNPYFYNPFVYNNFYNPYGYFNYYPHYNYGGNFIPESPNSNPPQSKPRQVIGSNLPATNGGTIDNPNPNPLKTIKRSSDVEVPNQDIIDQPNQARSTGNTGTLITTPNGVQYIAPRNSEPKPPTYSTYDRSVENNNRQTEFRNANPQYTNPAPIQNPNAVRSETNPQSPTFTQPNYTQPNYTPPTYTQPNYTPSNYNTPRSNGGGGFNGGSSGGGGGRNSGGGGGVSRPR
jgi:uncharacterized membrane protein YgcG